MSAMDNTNAAVVISQVWDTQVLQARYASAVIMPRVLNKSQLVADYGSIVHVPIKPRWTGQTVASDGTFNTESQTLTEAQIAVDTWKVVVASILDRASKQSIVTLETEIPSQFGERLAEFYDTDLAALFTSLTGYASGITSIGTANDPVQFTEPAALNSVLALRKNNIALEMMSWILPPEAFYLGWLTKERMTNANTTGEGKSVLTTNYRQKILNVPAYESTLLSNTGDQKISFAGALIHKEAIGIAMQINNRYEKVRQTGAGVLGTMCTCQNLYGVKAIRVDHGIPIYVRKLT